MYENKLLFDNFNYIRGQENANKTNQRQLTDSAHFIDVMNEIPDIDDLELLNHKTSDSNKQDYFPPYSVTIKNPNMRPKSSSIIDWRGQISKPDFKSSKY